MVIKRRCVSQEKNCICREKETGLCEARWASTFGRCENFPYSNDEFYQILKEEEKLEKSFATKVYVREDGVVCS